MTHLFPKNRHGKTYPYQENYLKINFMDLPPPNITFLYSGPKNIKTRMDLVSCHW